MRRFAGVVFALLVLVGAAEARETTATKLQTFPKLRYGIGSEPTAGGGYMAGRAYLTRSAVVAWSERRRDLTLYLLRARSVNCRNLLRVATRPGQLIQALIKARPLARYVNRRLPNQTLQFITYYKDQPLHVSGLKQGVKLKFTRIDTYPGGVWHGSLNVPTKVYGDGKVYGYRGTFAARWCDRRR